MYPASVPTRPVRAPVGPRATPVTDATPAGADDRDVDDDREADDGAGDLDAVVGEAKDGDEVAFSRLFRATQPGLLRYLRVLVGADADDVASETWLQVARDLATFSGGWAGFRAWTATIGRHRAIDHVRRQRRRAEIVASMEQFVGVPSVEDTEASAVSAVETDAAIALIARLPREQAEAVMLRVVIGLDARTCGQILGRRAGAVRTAAHRGLRQLDRSFGQDIDRMLDRGEPPGSDRTDRGSGAPGRR